MRTLGPIPPSLLLILLSACASGGVDVPCNSDIDCGGRRCVDARCVGDAPEDAITPGAGSVTPSFTFPPIAGPSYTLHLETTETVSSGCGSAGLPNGVSTIRIAS